MIKVARLVIVASIIVTTVGISWHMHSSIAASKDLSDPEGYISEVFEHESPETAYELVKRQYASNMTLNHSAVHIAGGLLFDAMGLSGISVCDTAFGYGCYHGFMIRALTDEGLGAIEGAWSFCDIETDQVRDACIHGIGHGISQYLEALDLPNKLSYCMGHGTGDYACSSGVFMDFESKKLLSGTDSYVQHSSVSAAAPYTRCEDVGIPEKFKSTCYYSLPSWWSVALKMTTGEIGLTCNKISESYRSECFRGIGVQLVGASGRNVETIMSACDTMPTPQGREKCLLGSKQVLESFGENACSISSAMQGGVSCE